MLTLITVIPSFLFQHSKKPCSHPGVQVFKISFWSSLIMMWILPTDFCELIANLSMTLNVVYNFVNFLISKVSSRCFSGHMFYSIVVI